MRTASATAAIVALFLLASACRDATVDMPTGITPDSTALNPPVVPPGAPNWAGSGVDIPPYTGPYRTFRFSAPLGYPVRYFTEKSRFVLYDNGAFFLEYFLPAGFFRGRYTETDGVITFEWEGWSRAGDWAATAIDKDGTLTVRYNWIMSMTDFEDAVYRMR